MKWLLVTRTRYDKDVGELERDLAWTRNKLARAMALDEEERTAFYKVIDALQAVQQGLAEYNLPRLAEIETDLEFATATETMLRRQQDFYALQGRIAVGYERLTLLGVKVVPNPERPGCVTFVPEEKP